jgi:hypothetical protein
MQPNADTAPNNTAAQSQSEKPVQDPGYNFRAPTPKLTAAFAKARAEFPAIPKNRTSRVMKDGKLLYEFHYADLADILTATTPALSKHGLTVSDEIALIGPRLWLFTELRHESGEMRRSTVPLSDNVNPQQWGGFLTYMRRYQTGAILGVASEEDDDGNRAAGNEHKTEQRNRKPKGDGEQKPAAGPSPAAGGPKPTIKPEDPASNQDHRALFAQAKTSKWNEAQLKAAVTNLWSKDSFKLMTHGEVRELLALVKKFGPGQFEKALEEGQITRDPDGHWTA